LKETRRSLTARTQQCSDSDIRSAAISSFRNRFEISSSRFFKSVGSSVVTTKKLARLSRFAGKRKIIEQHNKLNAKFWNEWAATVQQVFVSRTLPTGHND
jgi:hypothetical protein